MSITYDGIMKEFDIGYGQYDIYSIDYCFWGNLDNIIQLTCWEDGIQIEELEARFIENLDRSHHITSDMYHELLGMFYSYVDIIS